jgi:hypothetical protein
MPVESEALISNGT